MLCRSADYRAQDPDMDSGVEAGSDMTPPTPAFPISPPTPYGKNFIFLGSLFVKMYLWKALFVTFNYIWLSLFPLCFQ